MSRRRHDTHPTDPETKAILTPLLDIERATYQRPEQIWDDFLTLAYALFLGMARTVARGEALLSALSTLPEVAQAEALIRPRYRDNTWDQAAVGFGQAITALRAASEGPITGDPLGYLYMTWVGGSAAAGQFFTPFEVSLLIAQLQDVGATVQARVDAAEREHPELALYVAMLHTLTGQEAIRFHQERLVPLVRRIIAPVTVADPACGSGGMLLAVASTLEPWMLAYGLVQFHGIDVDRTCVLMAKVNLMRYGIAPWGIRHGNALSMEFFDTPGPEPIPTPAESDDAAPLAA